MTGRAIDQVLPHPSDPILHESYVGSAVEYLELAEKANGRIPKPASFSYIWGDVARELDRVRPRARISNLETSITTSEAFDPKGINYRMHPGNAPCLSAAKIDCCMLANNHVLDWGYAGLTETLATLHRAGIKTCGAGQNLAEALEPAVIELGRGARALVFGLGMTDSGVSRDWAAMSSKPGIAFLPDLSDASVRGIAENVWTWKRRGDIAILSIHWGRNWGYRISDAQRGFAHAVIDAAGIDVVHGHSSHHRKAIEVYRNKPILYGCGDFLNDYEGIKGYEEFRSDLVLMYFVTINLATGSLVRLEMTPLEIKRFRLNYVSRRDAAWLRDTLTQEGRQAGTEVGLSGDNRLLLQWQQR